MAGLRWVLLSYALGAAAVALFLTVQPRAGAVAVVAVLMITSVVAAGLALRSAVRRRPLSIASDESGSVALTTGLVLLLLLVIAGFSLDYIMASRARQTLQASLDAAALAAGREKTDAAMQVKGPIALKAQIGDDKSLSDQTSNFEVTKDAITADAWATYQPVFLGLSMKGPLKLHAHTQVKRAVNPLELALVLDTTGSMSGTKITTLKTAATNLVTKLTTDPNADVKIAVVPFAQYVNIGVSRRNMSWVSVPADYSVNNACYLQTTTSSTSCSSTYACTKYNDGVPYQSTCSSGCVTTTTVLVPPKTICPSPTQYKFSGCVGSPAYPKNVEDSDPYRVYPGYLNVGCSKELTPLTANVSTVKAAITALSPSGETYVPSGLAWGFNILSAPQPFTEAKAYDSANRNPRKAMVLMTDGENTKLLQPANGRHDVNPASGQPAKQANDHTAELCVNIKKQKIEVFAVAFSVTNVQTKKMLEDCATDSAHYFDASDPAALLKAFDDIAGALRDLYISQ